MGVTELMNCAQIGVWNERLCDNAPYTLWRRELPVCNDHPQVLPSLFPLQSPVHKLYPLRIKNVHTSVSSSCVMEPAFCIN